MKLKLHIAGWIAGRIQKRSRAARRALRDYQRQEWSRIRHDERRTRGLKLYIAWSDAATTARHPRANVLGESVSVSLGLPQMAR